MYLLKSIFTGQLSSANKAELDTATQQCKANDGEVLVTYFNVPFGLPNWVSGNAHNINYATSFPTLTVPSFVGQFIKSGEQIITAFNKYGYDSFSGTSMATPHVVGVAAKVWSHFPQCNNTQIRNVLNYTASDLGAQGRDNEFGHGLVNTKAAYDYIANNGCDIPASACPNAWYENKAYKKGQQVTFNGEIFEANYWTKNNLPTQYQGQYQQWKNLGACKLN